MAEPPEREREGAEAPSLSQISLKLTLNVSDQLIFNGFGAL